MFSAPKLLVVLAVIFFLVGLPTMTGLVILWTRGEDPGASSRRGGGSQRARSPSREEEPRRPGADRSS